MTPAAIVGPDVLAKLKAAGWIVVKADAIRLAQAMARDEAREEMKVAA
jgi:hypothetical protein